MYTVYALFDPRDPTVMRYVGVSIDPETRFVTHIYDGLSYGSISYKAARCRWINELLTQEIVPGMLFLEEAGVDIAPDRERWWIAALKKAGHPLLNSSRGGQSGPRHGVRYTDQVQAVYKEFYRSRNQAERREALFLLKPLTERKS